MTWRGHPSDFRTIIQSIAISLIIQVAVSPLTEMWIVRHRHHLPHNWRLLIYWLLTVTLAIPVVAGTIWAKATNWYIASANHERWPRRLLHFFVNDWVAPSLWDWAVLDGRLDGKYLVVEFDDHRMIGGVCDSDGGMFFTTPEPRGVFINVEWILDSNGDFSEPIPETSGVLIPELRNVRAVHVYDAKQ